MRCKKCKEKIEEYDIYCHSCGHPTSLLDTKLSAKESYKSVMKKYKESFLSYIPLSLFLLLIIIIPSTVAISYLLLNPVQNPYLNYIIINFILLIMLPFLFIPFDLMPNTDFSLSAYFQKINQYPKWSYFTFLNLLYYFFIKIISIGDPILNLVWLVLVNYWIAIIIPAFGLIVHKQLSPHKAIILAYKAGRETRWQQYFIAFRLFIFNLIGILALIFGMVYTIPLIYLMIEDYYHRIDDLTLFEHLQ